MKRPEKELHTHNSIPNYVDGLEEGCITCVRNKAIDDYEKFLPTSDEIEEIIYRVIWDSITKEGRHSLAQEIIKRLRGKR